MFKLAVMFKIRSWSFARSRRRWIGFGLIGVWALLPSLAGRRALVINTSPSVAPGIYWRSTLEPTVGSIVDFRIPPAARTYIEARCRQDGSNWYILKPIAAGPGDHVDATGPTLIINGHPTAPMPPDRDAMGRPLPVWRQTRVLGPDEFFVFSSRIPNSFDSRCYGPIRRDQIASVRRPLITW